MPRVAAKLDVMQISEITAVEAPDTFERPIYAGNAMMTVKSSDAKKVITVRPTTFEKVGDGGSAAVETLDAPAPAATSQFVSEELSKSDRPS
jgi:electron transfer flavoprotein alpha subunit